MSDASNDTRPMQRLGGSNWTAVILLGFSGQLAWAVENQFFNTFLYEKITPDPRPISWMVSITAVVALLTTILMGTLSDGARPGRWGRRRPFMLIGYLFWGVFTAVYPAATGELLVPKSYHRFRRRTCRPARNAACAGLL